MELLKQVVDRLSQQDNNQQKQSNNQDENGTIDFDFLVDPLTNKKMTRKRIAAIKEELTQNNTPLTVNMLLEKEKKNVIHIKVQ